MFRLLWPSLGCYIDNKLVSSYTLACVLCMGRGVGVGWGYEISCVLSREGDVGAWVLLCWHKLSLVI